MNGRRFDAMTRALGHRLSRRDAVRRASAIVLGEMAVTSRSVAPSHVGAAGTQGCEQPKTIRLWINTFVPNDLSFTVKVPSGDYQGRTGQRILVRDPYDYPAYLKKMYVIYLDDQRSYSNLPDAHSLIHSAIVFDVATKRIVTEIHRLDQSFGVRVDSGGVACGPESGRNLGIKFYPPVEKSDGIYEIDIEGKASLVCAELRTEVASYVGTFTIDLSSKGDAAKVMFKGKVDDFPAFEAYVSVNDAPNAKKVFGRYPTPGRTGYDGMNGGATNPVSGEAEIGCAPCSFDWASAAGTTSFDCNIPDTPCSGCVDGQCVNAHTLACSDFMFCYEQNYSYYGTYDVCLRQAD